MIFKKLTKNIFLLFSAFFFISLFGCSSADKSSINTDDPDRAFRIAKKNYDEKDYLQAIEDFSFIKVKFSGTSVSDKAQYYLGMSYYNREEFILAAYEFEYLIKNFATSSFAVDGRYMLAMSYYGLSPEYSLDQTYTKFAINEFKNFLELYPENPKSAIAESKIKELKNKLAYKELKAAELYIRMDSYKSALVYYENILQDYFDTDYADDALYGKINTLIKKKRYADARKEIERFESRFPKSPFMKNVQNIKNKIPTE